MYNRIRRSIPRANLYAYARGVNPETIGCQNNPAAYFFRLICIYCCAKISLSVYSEINYNTKPISNSSVKKPLLI